MGSKQYPLFDNDDIMPESISSKRTQHGNTMPDLDTSEISNHDTRVPDLPEETPEAHAPSEGNLSTEASYHHTQCNLIHNFHSQHPTEAHPYPSLHYDLPTCALVVQKHVPPTHSTTVFMQVVFPQQRHPLTAL